MRQLVLFIAMSLDGYIADSRGSVDWLEGEGSSEGCYDSYAEFAKTIDTVFMGWNTYHQVVTELSVNEWVYSDFTSYVFTHRKLQSSEQIIFTDDNPIDVLNRLKKKDGKDIWICGGSNLIEQYIQADAIDRYYISIIPTLLGNGTRLFPEMDREQKLTLLEMRTENGIVELIYAKRQLPASQAGPIQIE